MATTTINLESLPTEIIGLVLSHVDSWASLSNALRASPRMLNVYVRHRDAMFTSVVRNQISPRFLSLAITTQQLRASSEGVSNQALAEAVTSALDEDVTSTPLSISTVKALFKFHQIVDRMVEDITTDSLSAVQAQEPSQDVGTWASLDAFDTTLSTTESTRTRRALYNYEMLGHLTSAFLSQHEKGSSDTSYEEVLRSFISQLPLYEIEEIHFVASGLFGRMRSYLDRVEDARLQQFVNAGPHDESHNWECTNEDMFFSTIGGVEHDLWIQKCLWTRGLSTMHNMIYSNSAEASLRQLGDVGSLQSLQSMVELFRSSTRAVNTRQCSQARTEDQLMSDDPDQPNAAFAWVNQGQSPCRSVLEKSISVAYAGYSIWDSSRLQKMKVLKNPKRAQRCARTSQRYRPSVESRARKQELRWQQERLKGTSPARILN